tara:strand:- start:550 stop:747 length:198 start_codon:yes stop_codon:yes gene_type:complete
MSTLLKTLGYITGYAAVSYLALTSMMQDPNKPYRGHLNIRTDNYEKKTHIWMTNPKFLNDAKSPK